MKNNEEHYHNKNSKKSYKSINTLEPRCNIKTMVRRSQRFTFSWRSTLSSTTLDRSTSSGYGRILVEENWCSKHGNQRNSMCFTNFFNMNQMWLLDILHSYKRGNLKTLFVIETPVEYNNGTRLRSCVLIVTWRSWCVGKGWKLFPWEWALTEMRFYDLLRVEIHKYTISCIHWNDSKFQNICSTRLGPLLEYP